MSEMFTGPRAANPDEDAAPVFRDPNAPHPSEVSGHLHSGVLDDDLPEGEQVEKAPIWLVTFGDVTALMLAFFVMLYSMSHLQSEKWDAVISILATRDDPVVDGDPRPVGERTITRVDLVGAFPVGYLQRILEEKLEADPVLSMVRLSGLDGALVMSLPADQIFDGPGAVLNDLGRRALARLAVVFGQFGNRLDVHGNTDPLPLPDQSDYADKWELSLGRAMAVAKSLRENGFDGDFTVMGLADSGYRHIDPSIPEARRLTLSRRVDIVILPEARGQ